MKVGVVRLLKVAVAGKGQLSVHIDEATVQRRAHAHEFPLVLHQGALVGRPGECGGNQILVAVDQRASAGAVLRHDIEAIGQLVVDRAGGIDRGTRETKRVAA